MVEGVGNDVPRHIASVKRLKISGLKVPGVLAGSKSRTLQYDNKFNLGNIIRAAS